jgi:hypothetical protein
LSLAGGEKLAGGEEHRRPLTAALLLAGEQPSSQRWRGGEARWRMAPDLVRYGLLVFLELNQEHGQARGLGALNFKLSLLFFVSLPSHIMSLCKQLVVDCGRCPA